MWFRMTISPKGDIAIQREFKIASDWGKVEESGTLEPISQKTWTTGERWFGFMLKDQFTAPMFVIEKDGELRIVPVGECIPPGCAKTRPVDALNDRTGILFKHQDAFPFSK